MTTSKETPEQSAVEDAYNNWCDTERMYGQQNPELECFRAGAAWALASATPEPLTLERACEVLNERKHRGARTNGDPNFRWSKYSQSGGVVGEPVSNGEIMHSRPSCWLNAFEAIAIAREHLRQPPAGGAK